MVFELDLTTNVFHSFAEYLYGNNMVEQQNWEEGKYYLSSLNFGGLEDTSSFEVRSPKKIWSKIICITEYILQLVLCISDFGILMKIWPNCWFSKMGLECHKMKF